MNKTIIAVALAAAIQILSFLGLTSYLVSHNNDVAQQYALLAEENAKAKSNDLTMRMYQQMLSTHNADVAELKEWTDKQITLRLSRAGLPLGIQSESK